MHKVLTNYLGRCCAPSHILPFTLPPLFQNSGSATDLLMARARKKLANSGGGCPQLTHLETNENFAQKLSWEVLCPSPDPQIRRLWGIPIPYSY